MRMASTMKRSLVILSSSASDHFFLAFPPWANPRTSSIRCKTSLPILEIHSLIPPIHIPTKRSPADSVVQAMSALIFPSRFGRNLLFSPHFRRIFLGRPQDVRRAHLGDPRWRQDPESVQVAAGILFWGGRVRNGII